MSTDVLILCGAGYVSGKEIMVLTLARGLMARGASVHVATSSWNNGDFIARMQAAGIAHSQLRMGFISLSPRWKYLRMTLEQAIHWPGLALRYASLRKRLRPRNVLHTNWHHAALLLPFLRADRDLLWLHEVIPARTLYRALFDRMARRLRELVAVSEAVRGSLLRVGVPPSKVRVIHNGIADPPGEAAPRATSPRDVCAGIIGQVGLWKGHEDLVEAFALVADEQPRLRLRIVGEDKGSFQDDLRRRIAKLGLAGRVEWTGYVKDPMHIYKDVDICVVPSRSEDPLPTVAIEAGSRGIPVIATRRGGLPEIVEEGETGLLVDAQSPPQLARALAALAGDGAYRARLGANARARIRQAFSESRFLQAFQQVLSIPGPAHP